MSRYHFIGVGGIGMSALAAILRQRGRDVQGSESHPSHITDHLQEQGVTVLAEPRWEGVTTVVYGSAIRPDHPEYRQAAQLQLPLMHRSDMLAQLMEGHDPLLVTGTHGKTTTTALLTHLLQEAGWDPSYAVGGIPLKDHPHGHQGGGRWFVAEADESDGTLLRYRAYGAIITNLESDHLDFWGSCDALVEGMGKFAKQISTHLVWCGDDPRLRTLQLSGMSYGYSPESDVCITRWAQKGWSVTFDLEIGGEVYPEYTVPLLGRHNVLNAAAVVTLARSLGMREDVIRHGLATFRGVKRRMERKGDHRSVTVVDDYAHHPTEIQSTLAALRSAIGERRMIAVLQPHRYSRLYHCWDEFLQAFDQSVDSIVVTDVYGAGEEPIHGITGSAFAEALQSRCGATVHYVPRDQVVSMLSLWMRPHDVVITLGAGDITHVGPELLRAHIQPFRVALLQGGKSTEHEVSLLSAQQAMLALDPTLYAIETWTLSKEGAWLRGDKAESMGSVVERLTACDFVIPLLHGPYGEDGMIQGFLETLDIPYIGSDFRACVIAMDKAWTKRIALSYGVPVARFLEFSVQEWLDDPSRVEDTIRDAFQAPYYLKAVHLGSTFGVHRIQHEDEVRHAIREIARLDYRFIAEEEVCGRELEFGFMGDCSLQISEAAEVIRSDTMHTYENKYCSHGNPSIPRVPLPEPVLRQGQKWAETVYRGIGCSGLARLDFFLTPTHDWILNEVNPMPGFTPMSVYPAIWKGEGLPLRETWDRIVIASLHRYRRHRRHLRPSLPPPVTIT